MEGEEAVKEMLKKADGIIGDMRANLCQWKALNEKLQDKIDELETTKRSLSIYEVSLNYMYKKVGRKTEDEMITAALAKFKMAKRDTTKNMEQDRNDISKNDKITTDSN